MYTLCVAHFSKVQSERKLSHLLQCGRMGYATGVGSTYQLGDTGDLRNWYIASGSTLPHGLLGGRGPELM